MVKNFYFSFFRNRLRQNLFCLALIAFVFFAARIDFAQTKKPKAKVPVAAKTRIVPTTNANLPKVMQIDETMLKTLIKPNGKPRLINFWATWCDPCREEFPDLVKIAAEYKDKIDVITISLDELSELDGDVPKFLAQMKSDSPAYLLKTADEEAAIATVSKDWQGGLPFTVLIDEKGAIIYSKMGKFKPDFLRSAIKESLKK